MTAYNPSNASIHVLARAVIVQGDAVLVCRHGDHRFLPGGHVENGESLLAALEREFVEELGTFAHGDLRPIGVCEHRFEFAPGVTQHEINHIFVTEVGPEVALTSQEHHLSFEMVALRDLPATALLPTQLKEALVAWFADRKEFFVHW